MSDSILRLEQVKVRTGRGRTSIYDDIKRGTFPRPVLIGRRAVGWLESAIEAWIQARVVAGAPALSAAGMPKEHA